MRTAQATMRHSDPKLTANIYTDPELLDVAGALETLPKLPLNEEIESEQNLQISGETKSALVAPTVAPNSGFTCHLVSQPDKTAGDARDKASPRLHHGSTTPGTTCHLLARDDRKKIGGRYKIRTCDPLRVKQVL